MDDKLLDILKTCGGYISGEELGKRLGVSRTAVWKKIAKLKNAGYEISAVTNKGYILKGMEEDMLNESEIKENLKASVLGNSIYYFKELDSTNNEARKLGEANASEGALVVCDTQTGGRGRLGRPWVSLPKGGIWMSILLRPDIYPQQAPKITLVAGLSVCKAINKVSGADTKIKWPNDILLNGKKLCGILTEMNAEMEKVNYVVTGIGINVNIESFPDEIKDVATSLIIENGQAFKRKEIIKEVLLEFEKNYFKYIIHNNFSEFVEEYKKNCITLGKNVKVLGKESFNGVAFDINKDGELWVRKENGEEVLVFSGEVSVRG